jgi:hypothetical protein
VTLRVDDRALAAAAWPLVKTALESDASRAFFAKLVGSFYAEEAARLGAAAGLPGGAPSVD